MNSVDSILIAHSTIYTSYRGCFFIIIRFINEQVILTPTLSSSELEYVAST